MRNRFLPRRTFVLSALLLSAGVTSGCSKSDVQPDPTKGTGTAPGAQAAGKAVHADTFLTVSIEQQASWVRNFNPLHAAGNVRWPTVAGIYEPLLVYNTMKGEFTPWLASKYEWSNGNKTLTFTTRPGVKWSDGQPFTAKDVAFTFGLLKKHAALDLQGVWKWLTAVEVKNDSTVEFSLTRPYVPGLTFLGHQPIVPEHKWKDVADPVTFTNENPVATGPFTEVKTFQNQIYELGRNPNYWQQGKPAIKGLRFPAYPGNDQANLALLNGEVDWAGNFVPEIEKVYVGKDPQNHHYWFPLVGSTVFVYTNTTKKPLDDVRLRKALSMALDREQIVKVAMNNYTRPADATALSDAHERWRSQKVVESGDWVKFNVAKANQILDEAGYTKGADGIRVKDGKPLRFDINVVTGWSDWVRAAQIVTQQVKNIGVEASLRTYDFSAFFEALQKGTFDLSMGWSNEEPTPYNFYRDLLGTATVKPVGEASARNWHRFGAKQADSLFEAFEAATEQADQKKLLEQLQEIFSETAPSIPLFPGPSWGEFNTRRFTGFPSKENPYAKLSPNNPPEYLLVLTELKPK
ncbi:ABC transporter substrate-binding protein [Sorangium sp. So ce315]|uniref:ABC transporter substrate-binding protein n=1 Tax=Sorangium sp. So ce315 TaxID=3133299 RepID=UPI003F621922